MPSRPISAPADGLLSLLQVKNLGKLPIDLADSVQPVLNMEPWYLRTNQRWLQYDNLAVTVATSGLFQFTNGGNSVRVPDGEWWYVDTHSVGIVLPAVPVTADVLNLSAALFHGLGSINIIGEPINIVSSNLTAIAALASTQHRAPSLHGVWLAPGSTVGVAIGVADVTDAGGVNYVLFGSLTYTPIRV